MYPTNYDGWETIKSTSTQCWYQMEAHEKLCSKYIFFSAGNLVIKDFNFEAF